MLRSWESLQFPLSKIPGMTQTSFRHVKISESLALVSSFISFLICISLVPFLLCYFTFSSSNVTSFTSAHDTCMLVFWVSPARDLWLVWGHPPGVSDVFTYWLSNCPLIPAPAPSSNSSQKPPQLFSHPINTRPQPQFRQKKKWVTLWVPSHNYKLYHTWVLITLDILLEPFRAYCHIYFHCKTVLKSNLWLTDTYTNIQSHYVNNLVNVSLTGFQLLWGELLPFARCSDAAWETDL